MDYSGEEGSTAAHWVSFYLPLGGLSVHYPVGAYPFGPMTRASEWKPMVDAFLIQVARWIHRKVSINFALVGFEVDKTAASPETFRANGIPQDRGEGILWKDGTDLKWYAATRP